MQDSNSFTKFENLFYPRGFLLTDDDVPDIDASIASEIDRHFVTQPPIGHWQLHTHPSLPVSRAECGDWKLLVLGYLLDPYQPEKKTQDLTNQIVRLLAESYEQFLDRLDELSGRFLLLYLDSRSAYVMQDAIGTQSVFYTATLNDRYLASHEQLLADCLGYAPSVEGGAFAQTLLSKNVPEKYFPGTRTLFREIEALTPNTLLDLNTFRPSRFFPRQALGNMDTESAAQELSTLLVRQLSALSLRNTLRISLTAGLDSRTTLATAKGLKADYFTFGFSSSRQKDIDGATTLARHLGLEYQACTGELKPYSDADLQFLKDFKRFTGGFRSLEMGLTAKRYAERFPGAHIHVKSNGAEIGQARFRDMLIVGPTKFNAKMLSKMFYISPASVFCIKAFEDFMETAEFNRNRFFNYDFSDLFYWEHRMGRWQSAAISDFNFVHDTFIPFNNRKVLKLLLSVPLIDRMASVLQLKSIRNAWPEALEIPILKKQKHSFHRRLGREIYLRT